MSSALITTIGLSVAKSAGKEIGNWVVNWIKQWVEIRFDADGKARFGLKKPVVLIVEGKNAGWIDYKSDDGILTIERESDLREIIHISTFSAEQNNPAGTSIWNGADAIPDERDPDKWEAWLRASLLHDLLYGYSGDIASKCNLKSSNEVLDWADKALGAQKGGWVGNVAKKVIGLVRSLWLPMRQAPKAEPVTHEGVKESEQF